MENLITSYDLNTPWLEMEDFTKWGIAGKSKKKNEDGSTYRLLVSHVRNPIDLCQAAHLCGDEHLIKHWI